MDSFKVGLTASLIGAGLVVACSSESSTTGQPSSSTPPTESSYVDACNARAARCPDAGSDKCSNDYKCYTQAFVESSAAEVLDCLSSRACDEAAASTCLDPIAKRAGNHDFAQKCYDRLGECKLDDDYCQHKAEFFKPEIREAFEACLQKECSAILPCLDAALPACTY